MYTVLQSHKMDTNTELRPAKINSAYMVGVWDNDANEYYPNIRMFDFRLKNALNMAQEFYNNTISKRERQNGYSKRKTY